jgi:predicted ATP-grasp superfamily ATP-dependent carboligase
MRRLGDSLGQEPVRRETRVENGMHKSVLITDPDNRIALSVLRSLTRKNIEVVLAAEDGLTLPFFSRYCKESVLCPSAGQDQNGFMTTICQIVKRKSFATIFPSSDVSLITISKHRKRIAPYVRLALPSHESVAKVFDKSQTLKGAQEYGIPTPQSFSAGSVTELKDLATRISYPAVVKPKWSWIWTKGKSASHTRPFYVNSPSELVSTYLSVNQRFPEPMIQEYVPGHNISVAGLVDHGVPRVACCIKVYRAMPVTGGNSVLRESISLEPFPTRCSFSLLKALQWHGVAEVEFRIDSRDNLPKLTEVNGRFWASMDVAIESGVDFPYLLYRLALGDRIGPIFNYRTGVKYRWLVGDIENLVSTFKGEQRLVNVLHSSRLSTLRSFIKPYERGIHYDCLSADDPLPFFVTGNLQTVLRRTGQLLANPRQKPTHEGST